jgi:hypothetical protein
MGDFNNSVIKQESGLNYLQKSYAAEAPLVESDKIGLPGRIICKKRVKNHHPFLLS